MQGKGRRKGTKGKSDASAKEESEEEEVKTSMAEPSEKPGDMPSENDEYADDEAVTKKRAMTKNNKK